jgi:hypothetical protein
MQALLIAALVLTPVRSIHAQVGAPTFQDPDSIRAIHDSTLYGGPTTDTIMAKLGWSHYRIWEYNDEQRLNNGNGVYGPIAHIFASDALGGMTLNTFNAAASMGKLVGILFINPQLGSALRYPLGRQIAATIPAAALGGPISPTQVAAAATALGLPQLPTTYSQLSLSWGYNCVYLRHNGQGQKENWKAYVVPARISGHPCPAAHATAPEIPVIAAQFAGFTAHADYPAVARFHEGTQGQMPNMPLFGLKCARAWCFVMPGAGADTLPRFFANARPTAVNWQVPGWQDFQHLANWNPNPPSPHLDPDWGFHAAIVADRSLGQYTLATFKAAGQRNRWIHVATIHVDDTPPPATKYHTKWRLKSGNSEMYLRWETGGWNGILIVGNTGTAADTVPLSVFRKDHSPHDVPGTAKWRWVEKDEEVWVRCSQGCCKVVPN